MRKIFLFTTLLIIMCFLFSGRIMAAVDGLPDGSGCDGSYMCYSGCCNGGICDAASVCENSCRSLNQWCDNTYHCCDGYTCVSNLCKESAPACQDLGEFCNSGAPCCSGTCVGGYCLGECDCAQGSGYCSNDCTEAGYADIRCFVSESCKTPQCGFTMWHQWVGTTYCPGAGTTCHPVSCYNAPDAAHCPNFYPDGSPCFGGGNCDNCGGVDCGWCGGVPPDGGPTPAPDVCPNENCLTDPRYATTCYNDSFGICLDSKWCFGGYVPVAPMIPTCSNINTVVTSMPVTISWTNGGPLADTWKYSVNGGAAVTTTNFSADVTTVACGSNNWKALAENTDCGGTEDSVYSGQCTFCRHCAPTIPDWGATWTICNGAHKQSITRTCVENDGLCDLDDCDTYMANQTDPVVCPADSTCTYNTATNVQTRTRDCVGTITGTLFDASDIGSCGEMGTEDKYANQEFTITPANVGQWPIISGSPPTVMTNGSGVYAQNVYASTLPASYSLNYASLIASGLAAGIKFECQTTLPTVTGQAQVVTKDTGFWRVYGGWWQAVGGSVYAETGLKSYVPASVTATDQNLILGDTVTGRVGVLAHGMPWTGLELGTNPGVAVSTPLWRIESLYEGLRYDYNYYTTRMNIFDSTNWDEMPAISYNGGVNGYQIKKRTGDATLDSFTLSGTQKLIILVDGNVTVTGNVVVPSGAFLAVIAKGNITFNSNPSLTMAQGWFVAENINVPCHDVNVAIPGCDKDDSQFVGEGSFVGWSNISLGRDMNTGNNDNPSEKFVYRPDFVLNAPAPIKLYTKKFAPFIP